MPTPDKPKRPAPAHAFKPGFDPRRANINPAQAEEQQGKKVLVPVEGTGMLAAMRHVLKNPGYLDFDDLHAIARDLRRTNLKEFARQFTEFTKLEEQAKLVQAGGGAAKAGPAVESGSTSPPPAPDLGTDKALALVDRLLAEIGVKA